MWALGTPDSVWGLSSLGAMDVLTELAPGLSETSSTLTRIVILTFSLWGKDQSSMHLQQAKASVFSETLPPHPHQPPLSG